MYALLVGLQEPTSTWTWLVQSVSAGWPVISIIVGFVGGLGGLASLLITERAKAGHQQAIEGVKADYQRDVERLKADLAQNAEIARAHLNAAAFERQTRFARLHERRVDVVDELYRCLVVAEGSFGRALTMYREGRSEEDIQLKTEQDAKNAVEAFSAFTDYFREHRIWLDEALCERIDALVTTLHEAWYQFHDPDEARGRTREMSAAWRRVRDEVPAIRAEIERTMRIMLGVLDPPE